MLKNIKNQKFKKMDIRAFISKENLKDRSKIMNKLSVDSLKLIMNRNQISYISNARKATLIKSLVENNDKLENLSLTDTESKILKESYKETLGIDLNKRVDEDEDDKNVRKLKNNTHVTASVNKSKENDTSTKINDIITLDKNKEKDEELLPDLNEKKGIKELKNSKITKTSEKRKREATIFNIDDDSNDDVDDDYDNDDCFLSLLKSNKRKEKEEKKDELLFSSNLMSNEDILETIIENRTLKEQIKELEQELNFVKDKLLKKSSKKIKREEKKEKEIIGRIKEYIEYEKLFREQIYLKLTELSNEEIVQHKVLAQLGLQSLLEDEKKGKPLNRNKYDKILKMLYTDEIKNTDKIEIVEKFKDTVSGCEKKFSQVESSSRGSFFNDRRWNREVICDNCDICDICEGNHAWRNHPDKTEIDNHLKMMEKCFKKNKHKLNK